tara:strand:+ start:207 stop:437 length:231 start_codon:yes stop_codon:yes gene_type:complete
MNIPVTTVRLLCRICSQQQEIIAPVSGLMAWEEGAFIQDALPELSAGDREMLISQTCDDCWRMMFGDDEDEFSEDF